jgi:hypothetical protein
VSYADHDHRGEYASDGHDHYDYAERHHRHYDDESTVSGLREDLGAAEERIRELENNREVGQLRRDVNFADVVDDDFGEINEMRITALEELLYTRWPRRIAVRRRLIRDLRASVAHVDQGETFAERRSETISSGWVKPPRDQR